MTVGLRALALAGCATFAGVAASANAQQRLFRSDSALTVTITTELGPLLRERDSLELVKHDARFDYAGPESETVSVPVKLRARGHFRRQARNCDFPPLWLEVKSSDSKPTVLAGLHKLKIVTGCRPQNAEYEQYVLEEYAVYRAYAALTEDSFRTRLLRITYRDRAGKIGPVSTWGFFIEDVDDVAIHLARTVFPAKGARFGDIEGDPLTILSLFEYFIGNTDWSISGLHNIALLQDASARSIPVAFDFDWTGAVNPRYAVPDKNLPIHSVAERLYRGNCAAPEQLKAALERYKSRHAAMDAAINDVPLAPDRAKRMHAYFDDFWKRIDDPRGLAREIATDCQKSGN